MERISTKYVRENTDFPLVVAEIGVWKGTNAAWLRQMNIESLYLIDPYKPFARSEKSSVFKEEYLNRIKIEMYGNLLLWDSPIRFVNLSSVDAAPLFPDAFFDYVYIDGDHTYDAVYQDMTLWHPKVKPGGFLAGHDYPAKMVSAAVQDWCKLQTIEFKSWVPVGYAMTCPEDLANNDWLIIKDKRRA